MTKVWRGQERGPSSPITLQPQPRGLKRVLVLHLNSPSHKTQINSGLSPSQGGTASKEKPSKESWCSCEWCSWNIFLPEVVDDKAQSRDSPEVCAHKELSHAHSQTKQKPKTNKKHFPLFSVRGMVCSQVCCVLLCSVLHRKPLAVPSCQGRQKAAGTPGSFTRHNPVLNTNRNFQ